MKRQILSFARATGLLPVTDRLMLALRRTQSRARNKAFASAHPDFATPPDDLAFDAYNHVDWQAYRDTGRKHAEVYARLIAEAKPEGPLKIFEWGCGPSRILRHMRDCLSGREVALFGTDCNARSIAWCKAHIPDVEFDVNGFMPPLAFPDNTFDAVYNFSVFTHLSLEAQKAWAAELLRVLRPGGLLAMSTHGDFYRNRLAADAESERYERGEVVVQGNYEEGKKWFLALHPPRFVRETLLAGFDKIRAIKIPDGFDLHQDIWTGSKPE